jgi:acetolactate synthase-1/2/3 large subunit
LRNPDFPGYARAFGGFGASVERTEDFAKSFRDAETSGKPAIIRLAIDPESITPGTTLAKIRAKALSEKHR